MNHERAQRHASSAPAALAYPPDTIAPGQVSRSALLRKPDQAVASGLGQPKAGDANGAAATKSPAVTTKGLAAATKGSASTVLDLLGKSVFEPPAAVADAIDQAGAEGADVRVKLGSLTAPGVIRVKQVDGGYGQARPIGARTIL